MISPARLIEAGLGACALGLPLAVSPRAIVLAAAGCVALAIVVVTGRESPRTIVACAVVGNGFVFGPDARVASSVVLGLDALVLLAFLAAGAWPGAGIRELAAIVRSGEWRRRLGFGVAAIAAVVAATFATASGLWLVLAAMVAAFGAVSLAGLRSR